MPLLSSSVATIRLFNHMNFDRVKKCQLLKEIYGAGFKKLTGCHTSSWRASRSAHKLGKLENISNANDETIRYENDDGPSILGQRKCGHEKKHQPNLKRISDLHLMCK